jgi:hypothetical protein
MIFVLRVWVAAIGAAALSCAQTSTSLSGLVTDKSGAIIPNATVSATNASTGANRRTVADNEGFYSFPQLPSGTYSLNAAANGFAAAVITDIRVLVNTSTTLNIQLEVGAIAQSVDVRAETAQINSTDASIGNAFGTMPILQLPLEARNVVGLLALQPGVTFIGDTTDSRNGSVNGGRSDQANVTLDGVDVNDQQDRYAFTSVLRVTPDSVQEFRVTTINANAEQGRSSGAQIALVTKSGTNSIHGSLYEFHRNTVTTANSFFNNAATPAVERPKLIRNVFGGSVGAPVVRNRLFYFFNYEGRRDAKEGTADRVVPNGDFRQGIVRYARQGGSVGVLTPADIRGGIDPLGIGPNEEVLSVFKSYPLPNTTSGGDGLNTAVFRFNAPLPLRWNTYIARFDGNIDESGRHSVFLRGNLQNDRDADLPQFPGEPPNFVSLNNSKGVAAGYNWIVSPKLVGTLRYGFTRQGMEDSGVQTASAVTFFGLADRYGLTRNFARITPMHQASQEFTWNRGSHNLQFGAVQRWISNRRTSYANSFHTAAVRAARLSGGGRDLDPADLDPRFATSYRDAMASMLGLISSATANYNYDLNGNVQPVGLPVFRNFKAEEYELYLQDSWRATRSLHITAGLRWSLMPPVYEADGYQISPYPALGDWFNERGALAQAGRPQRSVTPLEYVPVSDPDAHELYPFHKRNLAPRISIAYSPQSDTLHWLTGGPGRSSIRAGWGMFYDLIGQSLMRNSDFNSFGLQTAIESPGSAFTESTAPRVTGLFDIPAVVVPPPPVQRFPIAAPNSFARGQGVDANIDSPYSMGMNFTASREFGWGILVQGSYIGRLSRKSLVQVDIANPADLRDPASGMTYFEAASQLARMVQAKAPVSQVPQIAFWENLWPGAAGSGLTATQGIYKEFARVSPGDYITALERIDRACIPACSVLGPNAIYQPQFASFTAWRSIGSGSYHAMQWTVRKRFTDGVQFDLNYTWSKSMDLASRAERDPQANVGIITNPWNPGQRKAVSDYDMTHQWNANWVAELPFGRGRKWLNTRGPLDAIFGGWQIAGLWRHTSGLPFTVFNGRSWPTNWQWVVGATPVGPTPESGSFKNAPAVIGPGGPNMFRDPNVAVAAYDYTLPGQIGERNGVRGDGFFTVDASLAKTFFLPYAESHRLQFRWEVFNVTNSVRFDVRSVTNYLTAQASFGKYTSTLTPPRIMQFGLRYEF